MVAQPTKSAEPPRPPPGYSARQTFAPCRTECPWTVEVLAVDDDSADLTLIAEALRRNPRVRASTMMHDPREALYTLVHGTVRPDLILLDIHMPKVDGFTFVKALRQAPWLTRTPVVLLTTSNRATEVERARESDVAAYIVKPDTFDDLQARIDGVIEPLVLRN